MSQLSVHKEMTVVLIFQFDSLEQVRRLFYHLSNSHPEKNTEAMFFLFPRHKTSTEGTAGDFAFRRLSFMGTCDGVIVRRLKRKFGNVKQDWQKVANATSNQISLESLNVD